MNESMFSLNNEFFKGSPCGGIWDGSAGWAEVALWGNLDTLHYCHMHQTPGGTLGKIFWKHLSLEGGRQVSCACKTEHRPHCMLSFLNGLITICKLSAQLSSF